ncbi:MAG: hypothetical protein AB1758_28210 [Candidatus Eremiobacterota bacterium]
MRRAALLLALGLLAMAARPRPDRGEARNWQDARTHTGETLGALSRRAPTLLVFLRHFG